MTQSLPRHTDVYWQLEMDGWNRKRARLPSSRHPDHFILERRKQEKARVKALELNKDQQICDVRATWQEKTERQMLFNAIGRQVKDALDQYQISIEERRDRLRVLLEAEEKELVEEMERKKETEQKERQATMRDRAKTLRDRRERGRQQLAADKLEQQFREQNEEVRAHRSKRVQDLVCTERAAQLHTRQALRQRQLEEEALFADLWDADRRAKEERESKDLERRRQKDAEQLDVLKTQVEASEQQRQQDKKLKEEEAALLLEQREMSQLMEKRERLQKLRDQEARRVQLDRFLRLKMKRLARDEQEELALDLSVLQKLLEEDKTEDVSQRKAELGLQQQKYRQYLAEELEERRRQEEETEKLIEAELRETWARRERKSHTEREARGRLMKDVMEGRSLQIQHKLDLNAEKQRQLSKEAEELNQRIQAMKTQDEEAARRHRQTCQEHQAQLLRQMKHQRRRSVERRVQEQKEYERGQELQEQRARKIQEVLSRPDTAVAHPYRRTRHSGSAPLQLGLDQLSLDDTRLVRS